VNFRCDLFNVFAPKIRRLSILRLDLRFKYNVVTIS